jgi:DNA-binding NtrC family response regulator
MMLKFTTEAVRELGYTALHADNAAAALAILDDRPDIRLLFTDVVMPDISGNKLADEALVRRPELKVLYTTGYTANAVVHGGVLDAGVNLLGKPFTLEQLAGQVAPGPEPVTGSRFYTTLDSGYALASGALAGPIDESGPFSGVRQ